MYLCIHVNFLILSTFTPTVCLKKLLNFQTEVNFETKSIPNPDLLHYGLKTYKVLPIVQERHTGIIKYELLGFMVD